MKNRPVTVYSWPDLRGETGEKRGNAPTPAPRKWIGKTPADYAKEAFDRLSLGRKGKSPADLRPALGGGKTIESHEKKSGPKPVTTYGESHRNHAEGRPQLEGVSAPAPEPMPQKITSGTLRFDSPVIIGKWVGTRVDEFKAEMKKAIEQEHPGATVTDIRIEDNVVWVDVRS